MDLQDWLSRAAAAIADWEATFPPFARHPSLEVSDERFAAAFAELAGAAARATTRSSTRATRGRCSSRRTRPRWPATSPRC